MAEVLPELLIGVGRNTERPDMEDLGIEDRLGVIAHVLDQRLHQILWFAAAGADEDAIPAVDLCEDLLLGCELLGVLLAQVP